MTAPILLSTWPFADAANRAAWPALAGGCDGMDAVEEVCRHVELDPAVENVGFGGLPDRDGDVTLDALVMRSPARMGAVCALRRTPHAASVARRVMEESPHNLLAGAGADTFATEQGFDQQDLLAAAAREKWEAWVADGRPPHTGHDTVCSLALDTSGELAGAVSTSGLCWKYPGRVGDSPLPGHGLYVYPGRGAAAATGDGELVQGCCSSFAAVEAMAAGASPLDALMAQMESLRDAYDLSAKAQVAMIAIAPDGRFATAALRSGFESALAREGGFEVSSAQAVLFEG